MKTLFSLSIVLAAVALLAFSMPVHAFKTLTGKAGNTAETDLVTKLAGDVNGVQGVKNRMTIR